MTAAPQDAPVESVQQLEYDGEDDDEEGDEEDEENDSASEGDDLREELEEVLEGDFDFKGSYAYSSLFTDAPNPVLDIIGVGPIGLPLSPRDAQLIITSATQAPFGHGTETKVDTSVRHTWEIEPARVSFGNAAWQTWMEETVVRGVATALGVPFSTTPPKCELYKLLLYEQDSHFLPHQDTVKAQNMFATIIIVLPSPYTGGQVHVSHSSSQQVFSFDSNSLLSTAVMAWYTDVQHEVKPITSGYRLALSYNLVHVTPGVPPPILPDMHSSIISLRRVLKKWRTYKYPDIEPNIMCHILSHKYSPAGLSTGFKALKGKDSYLVAQLMPLAAEQEFFVGLANLTYHQTGTADGDGGYGNYYKRRRGYGRYGYGRYGYYGDSDCDDEDDEEVPGIDEVIDTTLTVDNLFDMAGNKPAGSKKISLDLENLVQEDAFEDVDPDEDHYEGYMGNYSGEVEQCKRTVLIIMPEESARNILYTSDYALGILHHAALERPGKPSPEDLFFADLVLNNSQNSPATLVTMAQYAVSWNNLELWKKVLRAGNWTASSVLPPKELVTGWKLFSFDSVRSSFEQIVQKAPQISRGISLIRDLVENGPQEDCQIAQQWAEQLISQLLTTLEAPTVQDVSLLIETARKQGLSYLTCTLIPRLEKKSGLHDFWLAMIKELESNRTYFVSPPEAEGSSTSETQNQLENTKKRCLDIVVCNWEHGIADPPPVNNTPYYSHRPRPPPQSPVNHTTRVIQILDLCIDVGVLDTCKVLLGLVMKKKPPTSDNFQTLYSPVISHIRQKLLTTNDSVSLNSDVFVDFMGLILQTLKTPSSADVPWIIDIVQAKGAPYMIQSFVPRLEKNVALYDFWYQFITTLVKDETVIVTKSTVTDPDSKNSVRKFIERCLFIIVTNWEHGLTDPVRARAYPYYQAPTAVSPSTSTPSRITELVELCFLARFLDPLTRLWSLLAKAKPLTLQENFQTIYNPLIPQLCQLLMTKNLDISSSPFLELIQVVLGSYLRFVLGARPNPNALVPARKLGCGCSDCQVLDNFLMSKSLEQTFRLVQARRTHLERQLYSGRDLVSFTTIRSGSPHGLVSQTKTFLGTIGDGNMLRKIAGHRYGDVLTAFEGKEQFMLPWNSVASTSASTNHSSSGATGRTPSTTNSNPTAAPISTSLHGAPPPHLHNPGSSSTQSTSYMWPSQLALSASTPATAMAPGPSNPMPMTTGSSALTVPGTNKRKKSTMVSMDTIDLTGED
ncbi:hypothetical protein GG344DRAFT_78922 [Lentinula edodes]|nr:hypothetical protein GG344DRAFT_78922 [Lentinula edodes]